MEGGKQREEGFVFPYTLHVAAGTNREALLSWRLQSGIIAPKAWVWIIGWDSSEEFSKAELRETCNAVGSYLALRDLGVICEGNYQIDLALSPLINGFIDNFKYQRPLINSFVTIWMSELQSSGYNTNFPARVELVIDEEEAHNPIINKSQFALLCCGTSGSLHRAKKAFAKGLPVYPILDSGGVTKDFYSFLKNQTRKNLEQVYGPEFQVHGLRANVGEVLGEAFDASKRVLDRVSYLNEDSED